MSVLPSQTSLQNGDFVLCNVLGRGGFGITYRARDTRTMRDVAIKECFPPGCQRDGLEVVAADFSSRSQNAALQSRFCAQAAQLSHISHPHLARVRGFFEENGTSYLVMELVEGQTLLRILEKEAVAPDLAQSWIEKIAGALGALHDGGLLHLDVKPENIILRRAPVEADLEADDEAEETQSATDSLATGEPVLLDFDLVQPQSLDSATRPLALSMQCGTPGYAPLEQYAAGARLSPSADFYALGATFYQLVSGQIPLGAIERIAGSGEFIAPAILCPQLQTHQNLAILGALALQSEDRPQNAADFRESLQPKVVEAAPDDDDYSAPGHAAQFLKHGTGVYRVVLTAKNPVFPRRCACCHEKADATWILNSPSGHYELPSCEKCARHQLASRAASFVTFWGSLLSLALALLVALISVVTATLFLLFVSAACIILNFAALSYGALKSSRAEEMMRNSCCDLSAPATYNYNGQVHIWRFKNAAFAADFKKRNAASVV